MKYWIIGDSIYYQLSKEENSIRKFKVTNETYIISCVSLFYDINWKRDPSHDDDVQETYKAEEKIYR